MCIRDSHFGTLLAVFWVFRRDFLDLLKFPRDRVQRRFLLLLILGCIPTAIIGYFLGDFIESISVSYTHLDVYKRQEQDHQV